MRNIKLTTCCFLLFWPTMIFCQPSINRTESRILFKSFSPQQTIRLEVKNTTKDTIYIWLQNEDVYYDENEAFPHYFFSNTSDFPLSRLCFDGNIIYSDTFTPVLGVNFIKKLDPEESFYIYSVNYEIEPSVVRYDIQKNVKKIVPLHILNQFNYYCNYIVLGDTWNRNPIDSPGK